MTQVLRNKNLATRFQILVEIAANQPNIQQKDIAQKIGVTSQAVSEYVNKLEKDGWITSDGRSRYRITKEGVNWVLKSLRELQQYSTSAERVLTNITTWAAIAAADLKKGQKVGLMMKDGLFYASNYLSTGARGITTDNAKKGEDVGISDIEEIVELVIGQITVLEVPDIQRGGSRNVDANKMKKGLAKANLIGAIGVEAIVALRQSGIEPGYLYGVAQAAIEVARSGLPFTIVCTSNESPALLQRLNEENLKYTLVDTRNKR
ncbi:MAG: winged helix-turn-helix transcriptional regulator [Chloroflexi bacterium]|nr:winged helix-turn-helix transcriptional regulator [Chloroflexota bacterium]